MRGVGELMGLLIGALALAAVVALLLSGRGSRAASIRPLPGYGTIEASELQTEIARQGPARLLSAASAGASPWIVVEPVRSEAYFREHMNPGGRSSRSPLGHWRRARSKPVRPKPLTAPRPRPGFAPPRTILILASHCRICGRQLTNSESQRRGVGPDCYRNYGDRVRHDINPAYTEWSERQALMQAQQIAWQSMLDEMNRYLMVVYEAEMENWSRAGGGVSSVPVAPRGGPAK